jgi:hypothetical protein
LFGAVAEAKVDSGHGSVRKRIRGGDDWCADKATSSCVIHGRFRVRRGLFVAAGSVSVDG